MTHLPGSSCHDWRYRSSDAPRDASRWRRWGRCEPWTDAPSAMGCACPTAKTHEGGGCRGGWGEGRGKGEDGATMGCELTLPARRVAHVPQLKHTVDGCRGGWGEGRGKGEDGAAVGRELTLPARRVAHVPQLKHTRGVGVEVDGERGEGREKMGPLWAVNWRSQCDGLSMSHS